jgi:hypothetical protein
MNIHDIVVTYKTARALNEAGIHLDDSVFIWVEAEIRDTDNNEILCEKIEVLELRGEKARKGVHWIATLPGPTLSEMVAFLAAKYPGGEVTLDLSRSAADRISDTARLLMKTTEKVSL